MSDLIERLRIVAAIERLPERGLASEAADYITTLEAQLAEARGEPNRIAAWLRKLGPWEHISPADLADAIAARAYVIAASQNGEG